MSGIFIPSGRFRPRSFGATARQAVSNPALLHFIPSTLRLGRGNVPPHGSTRPIISLHAFTYNRIAPLKQGKVTRYALPCAVMCNHAAL